MPILLEILLQLLRLLVTNFYRSDAVVCFLELDRAITDIFAWEISQLWPTSP